MGENLTYQQNFLAMNIQEIFKLADPVYALTDKVIIKTTRENYTVNKALLILLSPKYRNELKINPTIKSIELQINDNLKEFFDIFVIF